MPALTFVALRVSVYLTESDRRLIAQDVTKPPVLDREATAVEIAVWVRQLVRDELSALHAEHVRLAERAEEASAHDEPE